MAVLVGGDNKTVRTLRPRIQLKDRVYGEGRCIILSSEVMDARMSRVKRKLAAKGNNCSIFLV